MEHISTVAQESERNLGREAREEEVRRKRERRDEIYARWFKEVGLLCLAALVLQNIIEGTYPLAPSVIVGVIVAGVSYYQAYRLIETT